eukprot:2444245-Amphidinium_carterae.1
MFRGISGRQIGVDSKDWVLLNAVQSMFGISPYRNRGMGLALVTDSFDFRFKGYVTSKYEGHVLQSGCTCAKRALLCGSSAAEHFHRGDFTTLIGGFTHAAKEDPPYALQSFAAFECMQCSQFCCSGQLWSHVEAGPVGSHGAHNMRFLHVKFLLTCGKELYTAATPGVPLTMDAVPKRPFLFMCACGR